MRALPRYAPMLATAGEQPVDDDQRVFEVKLDGLRATAYV